MRGGAGSAIDALGPYFARDGEAPADAVRWSEIVRLGGADTAVAHTQRVLAARSQAAGGPVVVERRVAASVASLGLLARLLSPPVGAIAFDLPGPVLDARHWWLGVREPGPWSLSTTAPDAPVDLSAFVREVVEPMAARWSADYRVHPMIIRGNAASALMGALGVVAAHSSEAARRVGPPIAAILESDLRAGGGRLQRTPHGVAFRRGSCCLYYRVAGSGLCGDCLLDRPPAPAPA